MPAPFRDWTKPDEALKVIAARIDADLGDGKTVGTGKAAYDANRLYVEYGNHWQDGKQWPTRHPDIHIQKRRLALVEPMFAPVGVLQSCAINQTDALLSREAKLDATAIDPAGPDGAQSDTQVERGKYGLDRLSAWWDAVKLWDAMRLCCTRAAWATRAPLRLRMLDTAFTQARDAEGAAVTVTVGGLTFEDALSRIVLETPEPQDALIHTDPETHEVCCIIAYKDENDQQAADVWYMERQGDVDVAVRRIITTGGAREIRFPGSALPLAEVAGNLLIGEPERRAQAQLDYTSTKLTYIIQYASHPATFTIDAEPHGEWSPSPPTTGPALATKTDENGQTWYLHPAQWDTGAEVVHELYSRIRQTMRLEGGGQTGTPVAASEVTKANVTVVEPVDPVYLTTALDAQEARLKRQMRQGHTVTKDKATSGEEKKQDRADFEKQVGSYQVSAELAVANVLTAAGRIALLMTAPSDPMQGWFDEYAISCTLRIDTGPLSSEEIKEMVELAEKGYIPRSDVMMAAGRQDNVAMAEAAIMADPVQSAQRLAVLLDTAAIISDKWNAQAAIAWLRLKGAPEELLAAMGRGDFTGVTQ